MEVCPTCKKEIDTLKLLKCKFCDKNCCSLSCLVNHASNHLGSNDTSINIVNSLKRRQSEKATHCMIPALRHSRKGKAMETVNGSGFAGMGDGKEPR